MLLAVEFSLPSLRLPPEFEATIASLMLPVPDLSGDAACMLPLLLPLRCVISVDAESEVSILRLFLPMQFLKTLRFTT